MNIYDLSQHFVTSDAMDGLDLYTPTMIDDRAEVRKGDLLYLHTGWHKHARFGDKADEEKSFIGIQVRLPIWCRGCSKGKSKSGASTASRRTIR